MQWPGGLNLRAGIARGGRALPGGPGNGSGDREMGPGAREMGPMGPPRVPEGREMGPMGPPRAPEGWGLRGGYYCGGVRLDGVVIIGRGGYYW